MVATVGTDLVDVVAPKRSPKTKASKFPVVSSSSALLVDGGPFGSTFSQLVTKKEKDHKSFSAIVSPVQVNNDIGLQRFLQLARDLKRGV